MEDIMAPEQQTCITFPDKLKGGVYANKVVVTHSKEEFIVDYMFVTATSCTVASRVIVSPAHMKRIVTQIHDDVVKYQGDFEKITAVDEPGKIK
jgi:hypothetical protein